MGSKNSTSDRCPKCGSTEISLEEATGRLRCHFCRHSFEPVIESVKLPSAEELNKGASKRSTEEATGLTSEELKNVHGEKAAEETSREFIADGAKDIDEDASKMVSMRCEHCGAEVTVNFEEATGARCHWCRNNLSVDNPVPSGAVPDIILPFKVTKEEAQESMTAFAQKRTFFAHPQFIKEFTLINVMGVYFPYFVISSTGRSYFNGTGEILRRKEVREDSDGDKETIYWSDRYKVDREGTLNIGNLTLESSADFADINKKDTTNNIINSIMPFDTENSEKYKTHYTRGYNIENRTLNVKDITEKVDKQSLDIARYGMLDYIKQYDRGVAWHSQRYVRDSIGVQSAYFPVWLYSYMDQEKKKHYIAVNARTKETMGSIPLNFRKLFTISFGIEVIAIIILRLLILLLISMSDDNNISNFIYLMLLSGPLFYVYNYFKYSNRDKVHVYETDTDYKMINIVESDTLIETNVRSKRRSINGRNDNIRGSSSVMLENPGLAKITSTLTKFSDTPIGVAEMTNLLEKRTKLQNQIEGASLEETSRNNLEEKSKRIKGLNERMKSQKGFLQDFAKESPKESPKE